MNEQSNDESKTPIDFKSQRICPMCSKILDIQTKICDKCKADLSKIKPIGDSDEILKQIAISAINDPDANVRKEAIDSLGDFEELKVLGVLTYVLLNDSDENVRKEATDELGDIHHEYSIEVLIQALNDPSSKVRKEAIEGLKKILEKVDLKEKGIDISRVENAIALADKALEKGSVKSSAKKTQGHMIQEALGLSPLTIQEIEKKLFISRFFDYFIEETLDFIHKDRFLEQNLSEIIKFYSLMSEDVDEENKLLKRSFESKEILKIIGDLKKKAEALAASHGITESVDARTRRISIIMSLPMIGLLVVVWVVQWFLPPEFLFFIVLPLLCVFCVLPQNLRMSIYKKWNAFKEQNKHQFYSENREDIILLKTYTGEILDNIRSLLIDKKVPLQLIKFVLHSRDYENLKLERERTVKGGSKQYFFSFEYPPGVEPFPIPDIIKQGYPGGALPESAVSQKPEENFIVLSELKAKDGVIEEFIPTLKTTQANKINEILNNCEFEQSKVEFDKIIPNYSQDLGIYCLCGELTKIINVQLCNWKKEFKFYLFESKQCDCGEKIYAISKIDDDHKVPDELKDIFLS